MIELRDVSYTYDKGTAFETNALKNISFSIEDGAVFGISGRTGSGKSTLLRLLGSLAKPTGGEMLLEGRVGLVLQFPEKQLFEESVIKDVMFGPRNLGLEDARERARKALEMVGIDQGLFGRSPFELSGGEQRRVAIAGILAMDPDVLVLDEPTAGLDLKGHDAVISILRRLNEEGRTIVLVSHDMDDVLDLCSEMVLLSDGSVIDQGKPEAVMERHPETAAERFTLVKDLKAAGYPVDLSMDLEKIAKTVCDQLS